MSESLETKNGATKRYHHEKHGAKSSGSGQQNGRIESQRKNGGVGNDGHKGKSGNNSNNKPTSSFSPYWSAQETAEKLRLGQCFCGSFRVNIKSGGEGYVSLPDLPQDVMFRQGRFQNRAIAGDTIAFRILPSSYWWVQRSIQRKPPSDDIQLSTEAEFVRMTGPQRRMALLQREIHNALRTNPDKERIRLPVVWDHVETPEEATTLMREVLKYFTDLRPTAEVVRILEETKRRKAIVGILCRDPLVGGDHLCLTPKDTDLCRKIRVDIASLSDQQKDLVKEAMNEEEDKRTLIRGELIKWEVEDTFPTAIVAEVIGLTGDIEVETAAIVIAHNISEKTFSEEAIACLPDPDWAPSEEDLQDRVDFRDKCVFSIDPATARDLDDAVSIERLDDNLYRVGVHIADVSHFVKPGTALDAEALTRTTSVYLVQRVIPMLPELLSSHLCSLQPGEDRLTFSIVWDMNINGEIFNQEISKTVIHSAAKLAYEHAQSVIDNPDTVQPPNIIIHGNHTWEEIKDNILILFQISQSLRKKRYDDGALHLDTPKISFRLGEDGLPATVSLSCQREANHLIQDFMLLANMSVAKAISDMYPRHALLRRHPAPSPKLLDDLKQVAKEFQVDLNVSTSLSMQKGMMDLSDRCGDKDKMDVILTLATKGMQLANYFCTGLAQREEWAHYALAMETYTHFTSPIRRYPDIIVHRQLHAAICVGEELRDKMSRDDSLRMQQVAIKCNEGKLSARGAQDASLTLYLRCLLLKEKMQTYGVVVSVKGSKFFEIYLPRLAISTRIFCQEFPESIEASFDKETATMTIDKVKLDSETKEKDTSLLDDGVDVKPTAECPRMPTIRRKTCQKRDKDTRIKLEFSYTENGVVVAMQLATIPKSPVAEKPKAVRLEFEITNDHISIVLRMTDKSRHKRRSKIKGKEVSKGKVAAAQSSSLEAERTDNENSALSGADTEYDTSLRCPFKLTRFTRVPIEIWVDRNKTTGYMTDIQTRLVVETK